MCTPAVLANYVHRVDGLSDKILSMGATVPDQSQRNAMCTGLDLRKNSNFTPSPMLLYSVDDEAYF
jgi:hypothetical protein